jgi:hypothetical protein
MNKRILHGFGPKYGTTRFEESTEMNKSCAHMHADRVTLADCVGIEDTGLTEALRCLTSLTDISLQNLPRVTNKSCIYIGKFIHGLISMDLSGTTQVRPACACGACGVTITDIGVVTRSCR